MMSQIQKLILPDKCEWKNCIRVFCVTFIMTAIIFLPFVVIDKGIFLFYGDYNVQQIPFYILAHDAIKNGNMGWNFYTDLGANFIGSYSFYLLGSPFFWLTIPFPSNFLPYLMAPLFVLKFSLASVTSYAFIRRFTKTPHMAIIGALLYVFSGFSIYNIFYNHFHEVIIFFPLLLIGLEELMVNNKKGLFALSVGLNLLVNYYFFVADIVFLVIYFLIRCLYKNYKISFMKLFSLLLETIIGVLIGMVLFLPSAYMVLANPRVSGVLLGYNMLFYNDVQKYGLLLQSLFFPPDMPAFPNFFPDANAKWYSVAAYIPVFSMSCVISFIHDKKKNFLKCLLLVLFIMMFIPILNSAFNGFNSSFYTRWFYILTLFLSLATVLALENRKIDLKFGFAFNLIVISAFMFIGILPKKEGDSIVWGQMPNYPAMFWINISITVLGILLAVYLSFKYRANAKRFYKRSIVIICVFCILYSTVEISWGKFNASGNAYENIVDKGLNANFTLDNNDFYRVDVYNKNYTDNWAMFWKLPTIQAFQSTVPASIINFYKSLGISRDVASRIPSDKYDGLRELLSVKYIFVEQKNDKDSIHLPKGFEFDSSQNGFNIYINRNFLPFGITFDNYITRSTFNTVSSNNKDRLLLKGILLNDKQEEKFGNILQKLSYSDANNYSDEQMIKDVNNLKGQSSQVFKTTPAGFYSEIDLKRPGLVLYSIPYEKGWQATVNGKPVDIEEVDNGLMAIPCGGGLNKIEFTYKTPGLNCGIFLSALGVLLLLIYLAANYKLKKSIPNILQNTKTTM